MSDRLKLFDHEAATPLNGLCALTEPNSQTPEADGSRVRAIIDIPLIGPRDCGKSELAAVLLRTLKARAPGLPRAETQSNRVALRAIMGGGAKDVGIPESYVPHYTFRVSIAALLDMLTPADRALTLYRARRLHLPIGSVVIGLGLVVAAGFFLNAALAVLVATALTALIAYSVVRMARLAEAIAGSDGEIEIVLWDPCGSSFEPERAAETYDFLAHLSRRRMEVRPPWRGYSFVPALVVNPIDYGQSARRTELRRLRDLLPMFAALGPERPRAMVAISRWSLVATACPSGASKDENITVSVPDRDGEASEYELPREAIASDLVETEDGNVAGVHLRYLRYEAAANVDVKLRDDTVVYQSEGCGGTFVGESQRSLVRMLAELALRPTSIGGRLNFTEEAPSEAHYLPEGETEAYFSGENSLSHEHSAVFPTQPATHVVATPDSSVAATARPPTQSESSADYTTVPIQNGAPLDPSNQTAQWMAPPPHKVVSNRNQPIVQPINQPTPEPAYAPSPEKAQSLLSAMTDALREAP